MAEFISLRPQTLATVGDAVAFEINAHEGNCNIRHREGSAIIRVKGTGSCCSRARYRVTFHGNVTGIAGAIQLAIYQDGEQLPESLMSVVPAAVADVWSVDTDTEVVVECDCSEIMVETRTAGATINTASIIINRIA